MGLRRRRRGGDVRDDMICKISRYYFGFLLLDLPCLFSTQLHDVHVPIQAGIFPFTIGPLTSRSDP